jgi:hypothetical protein
MYVVDLAIALVAWHHKPHFTGKETEALKGAIKCLGAHNLKALIELGFEPRSFCFQRYGLSTLHF